MELKGRKHSKSAESYGLNMNPFCLQHLEPTMQQTNPQKSIPARDATREHGDTSIQAGSFQKFKESNWNKMTTQVSELNQLN